MLNSPIIRGPGADFMVSGVGVVPTNRNILATTCTVGVISPARGDLPIVVSDKEYSAWLA